MGLKIHLCCFDRVTEECLYEDYSADLGDDGGVLDRLGLPLENNINNGGFDVLPEWVPVLQSFFTRHIEHDRYWYQVSFEYRDGDW